MHLLMNSALKLATRFANCEQCRLMGSAIRKETGAPITRVTSANNVDQRRYYDREKYYKYADGRYEKEYDLRYDKPSAWTIHPNYKLRMHYEEHAHLRGKSLLILGVAMFIWLYAVLFFIAYLPHPPPVGREDHY